jgi:transposase
MDRKKDNLDIRVLTREYSSELARAEAVRQYLEEVRKNGIQADNAQRSGVFERDKV